MTTGENVLCLFTNIYHLIQKYCLLGGEGGNDVFARTIYYRKGNRPPPCPQDRRPYSSLIYYHIISNINLCDKNRNVTNVFRIFRLLIIISAANIKLIFPKKIVYNVDNINNLEKSCIQYSLPMTYH